MSSLLAAESKIILSLRHQFVSVTMLSHDIFKISHFYIFSSHFLVSSSFSLYGHSVTEVQMSPQNCLVGILGVRRQTRTMQKGYFEESCAEK